MKTAFCSLLATPALLLSFTSCYVTPAGGPYGSPPPMAGGYHHGHSHDRVVVLPRGSERVVYQGTTYYTHGDTWYRSAGSGYTVVTRPSGYRSSHSHGGRGVVLPRGARRIDHRGTTYYTHGDTWYRPSGSSYVVVSRPSDYRVDPPGYRPDPRSGDRGNGRPGWSNNRPGRDRDGFRPGPGNPGGVVSLPRDARRVTHRGTVYYTHRDVWYRQSGSGYVVVGRPN